MWIVIENLTHQRSNNMAVSLTTVTGPIYLPNGATPVGGRVSFELSSWDQEEGEGLIISGPVYSKIDANGQFSVELFTSTAGIKSVHYRMFVIWEDSELSESYVNDIYIGIPTPHYTKKYIGSFALSGPGPFQVSDLNIISETNNSSFDAYIEMKAFADRIDLGVLDEAVSSTAADRLDVATNTLIASEAADLSEINKNNAVAASEAAQQSASNAANSAIVANSAMIVVGGQNPDAKRAMIGGAVLRNEGRLMLTIGTVTGAAPTTGTVVNGATSGATGTVFSFATGLITLNAQLKVFWQNGETVSWAGGSATLISQELWGNIEDNNHISRGFGLVDGTSNNFLVVPRTETMHKNIATIVAPDETFARFGITLGASSNLNDIRIYGAMPASIKFAATATPALIASQHNSFFTHDTSIHWTLATYTLSGVTGSFTVGETVTVGGSSAIVSYFNGTRLDIRGLNSAGYVTLGASGAVTGATSGATATITSETILKCWTMFHMPCYVNSTPTVNYSFGSGAAFKPNSLIEIAPERVSGTETRFYPFGTLSTRVSFTGSTWETSGGTDRDHNGGNAWSMVWNTDHLLVTHPPVLEDWEIDLTPIGINAYTHLTSFAATHTSFRLYFRAVSGGPLVVTPDANMSVYVKRGKMQLYNPWTGHILANFQHMELDLRRVVSSAGNIWVQTTNQINT
jgi:hypothetical protein